MNILRLLTVSCILAVLALVLQPVDALPASAHSLGLLGEHSTAGYTVDFDSRTGGIHVVYQHSNGTPAHTFAQLPSLRVDDVMPKRALSFTPIAISPKWTDTANHVVVSLGSFQSSVDVRYENIALYLQMQLIQTPDSFGYPESPRDFIRASAIPNAGIQNARNFNWGYLIESPFWNIPPELGGIPSKYSSGSYNADGLSGLDLVRLVSDAVNCEVSSSQPIEICENARLDTSDVTSTDAGIGTLPHFVFASTNAPLIIDSPSIYLLYPGVSSLRGGSDWDTGAPAIHVSFRTAWHIVATLVGDRYERREETKTECVGTNTYNANKTVCNPGGRRYYAYYYKETYRYYVWDLKGREIISSHKDKLLTDSSLWTDYVVVGKQARRTVSIPVYQALPSLTE